MMPHKCRAEGEEADVSTLVFSGELPLPVRISMSTMT